MTGHGQSSKSYTGIGSTLGPHRGAIDQTTTTTQPPPEVIKQVKQVLETMGVEIQVESEYKYRCIRARRQSPSEDNQMIDAAATASSPVPDLESSRESGTADGDSTPRAAPGPLPELTSSDSATSSTSDLTQTISLPSSAHDIVYGTRSEDPGDEVRFSVELTRLEGLVDTYSLDIRRLKGNLRSYKFLYDILRERANLQR